MPKTAAAKHKKSCRIKSKPLLTRCRPSSVSRTFSVPYNMYGSDIIVAENSFSNRVEAFLVAKKKNGLFSRSSGHRPHHRHAAVPRLSVRHAALHPSLPPRPPACGLRRTLYLPPDRKHSFRCSHSRTHSFFLREALHERLCRLRLPQQKSKYNPSYSYFCIFRLPEMSSMLHKPWCLFPMSYASVGSILHQRSKQRLRQTDRRCDKPKHRHTTQRRTASSPRRAF